MKTKAQSRKLKAETGVAPLWQNSPAMLAVFARVAAERINQRKLFSSGLITFDCASVIPDPNRKLRVLMEEVGEVAQELDKLEGLRDRRGERFVLEDLQEELVQVAAVAVAWLESLEEPKTPNSKTVSEFMSSGLKGAR